MLHANNMMMRFIKIKIHEYTEKSVHYIIGCYINKYNVFLRFEDMPYAI